MSKLLTVGNAMYSPQLRARILGALLLVVPKLITEPDLSPDMKLFLEAVARRAVNYADIVHARVLSFPEVSSNLLLVDSTDSGVLDDAILSVVERILPEYKALVLE